MKLVNNVITDSVIITNITNKVNLTGITTSFSGAAASGINSIPKYGDTQRHTQDDFSTINKTADVIITRL